MQFFVNKKSLLPVQEASVEAHKVFDLVKQQIMLAVVDFGTKDKSVVRASKRLVEDELPQVADSLFKGFIISFIDKKDTKLLREFNISDDKLPIILTYSEVDGSPIFCDRKLVADEIRIWG